MDRMKKQVEWLKTHEKKTGVEYIKSLPNFYNEFIDYIYQEIPKNKRDICDIGCGSGIVGKFIIKKNLDINMTFLDANPSQLASIKEGSVVEIDFLEYKPKEKFDCCVSRYFHHYFEKEDQPLVVKKIYEILKNSGVYVGATPLAPSKRVQKAINKMFYMIESFIDESKAIKRYFARINEMKKYFEDAGFKKCKIILHKDYKTNFKISDFRKKFGLSDKYILKIEKYLLNLPSEIKAFMGVVKKDQDVLFQYPNYIIVAEKGD